MIRFDRVMFATGRAPYTKALGWPRGSGPGDNGRILCRSRSQTNVPSVFAVGDVTDRVNLTPVAIREGRFADTIRRQTRVSWITALSPAPPILRPHEIGTIGTTEDEAIPPWRIEVWRQPLPPMRSAFAGSEARVMMMKLMVDETAARCVGCQIFGPGGQLIQMAVIPITMGATGRTVRSGGGGPSDTGGRAGDHARTDPPARGAARLTGWQMGSQTDGRR